MIQDDKNYYDEKNFVRDDWGGQVRTPQSGMPSQDQSKAFFMGSDEKPYPNDRNFVVDANATIPIGMTEPVPAKGGNPANNHFGQVKYARREGAPSIYKDATRNTADDNEASAKAEGSVMGCSNSVMDDDYEENQGGSQ